MSASTPTLGPPPAQPQAISLKSIKRLISLCASSTDGFMTEDTLRHEHNIHTAYMVDFQELHCLMSPWLPSESNTYAVSRYPLVRRVLESNGVPLILSPGCILELDDFLDRTTAAVGKAGAILERSDVSVAKSELLDYFNDYSDIISSTQDQLQLLRYSSTLAHAQSLAVASVSKLDGGLRKLAEFLRRPTLLTLSGLLGPHPPKIVLDNLRHNQNALSDVRADKHFGRSNRIDAHNITLADALNVTCLSGAQHASSDDPPARRYFIKLLTDTPAIYNAMSRLTLRLTYDDFLGHQVDLLENAESALLKQGLRRLALSHRDEAIEDLHDAANRAMNALASTNWREVRRGHRLDAVLFHQLPPGQAYAGRNTSVKKTYQRLAAFAWAMKRTLPEELSVVAASYSIAPLGHTSAAENVVASRDLASIVDTILEIKRILDAQSMSPSAGPLALHARKSPRVTGAEDLDTNRCEVVLCDDHKADFTAELRTIDRIREKDVARHRVIVSVRAVDSACTVVTWPRFGDPGAEFDVVTKAMLPARPGRVLGQLLSGEFLDDTTLPLEDVPQLIPRLWWLRLVYHELDYMIEIQRGDGREVRTGCLLDKTDINTLKQIGELLRSLSRRGLPAQDVLTREFWEPTVEAYNKWAEGRKDDGICERSV